MLPDLSLEKYGDYTVAGSVGFQLLNMVHAALLTCAHYQSGAFTATVETVRKNYIGQYGLDFGREDSGVFECFAQSLADDVAPSQATQATAPVAAMELRGKEHTDGRYLDAAPPRKRAKSDGAGTEIAELAAASAVPPAASAVPPAASTAPTPA